MLRTLLISSLASIALVACGGGADLSSPSGTMEAGIAALQADDFSGAIKVWVSDERYAELKSEFQDKRADSRSDADQRASFEEMMERLTKEGAEGALFDEALPELKKIAPMVSLIVPMMASGVRENIEGDKDLDESAREQALKTLDAAIEWLSGVELTDEARLKEAIAIACQRTRSAEFNDWDRLMALDFEGGMGAIGEAVDVVTDVVAVYGLDLDAALDSAQVETISETEDEAKLRIQFELFGPQSFETTMVKRGGRWIKESATTNSDPTGAAGGG